MNYESSNETCGTDGAFEKTYDWNENTQNFTNHAHEEKNKGIELVRQSVTRTAPPKYLKKTKMCKVSIWHWNRTIGSLINSQFFCIFLILIAELQYCVFCRNNNEPEYVYKSHQTRDIQNRISCSRLRAYVCPICGQSGDNAHTIKYCPKKPILTNEKIEAHNLCKHPH